MNESSVENAGELLKLNRDVLMIHQDDPYKALLAKMQLARVYICPYPGNSGDELIVRGTLALLESLGIKRTMNGAQADLLLYPGGNPTMWQEVIASAWQDNWRRFQKVPFLTGPTGFQVFDRYWIDAINQSEENVKALIARDPVSYAVLQSEELPPHIEKLLAHDPAFYLHGSSLLSTWLDGVSEEQDLWAFRNDHEGGGSPKQAKGLFGSNRFGRLSQLLGEIKRRNIRNGKVEKAANYSDGKLPVLVRDVSLMNFDMFLDAILRARHVHTDRLHVMICAALLNKKVYAYSTSYGKLEAIYTHSMQNWADVEFV